MAVMDEFREEREQLRTAPLKVKWQYFKDYYLLWTLGAILLIGIAAAFLYSVLTQKEEVFRAVLINRAPSMTAETEVEQAFADSFLTNPKREQIVIDTSIRMQLLTDGEETGELAGDGASAGATAGTSAAEEAQNIAITGIKYTYEDEEKLMLLVMTGGADLLVAEQDLFERYVAAEWYQDLRGILDEETLASYKSQDRLLYSGDVPIGIRMDDSELFTENYIDTEEHTAPSYAGIVNGCLHPDAAAAFLQFLK
ncbi:MAG: hypothetical protein IKG66_05095 [Lachnospiraceae bacterium]|nr:hypothetical protein [Lachnospiraceae bacterium]